MPGFFDRFFRPLTVDEALSMYLVHAASACAGHKERVRASVSRWKKAGCQTACSRITTADFARFRDDLTQAGLRPVSIEGKVANMMTILRHIGPKSNRTPHARGLIREVPWPGRAIRHSAAPKPPVPLEHLSLLYEHASLMGHAPKGFPRAEFLRLWLATAYNTGLRFGDLSRLAWHMIDLDKRTIEIKASKTGKLHLLPINDVLHWHLVNAPRVGELVAPVPSRHHFRREVHELCRCLELAIVTPQAIRRTAATEFERVHPGAGALLLGHTLPSARVTWDHYIGALDAVLRPASEKITQPAAFVAATRGGYDADHHATEQTDHAEAQSRDAAGA